MLHLSFFWRSHTYHLSMQRSRPTLDFKPPTSIRPLCITSLCTSHPLYVSGFFPISLASSSSPDSHRVLQWNAGDFQAKSTELLHSILSHPVDLNCIQESNLNSSSFFQFLDTLLCNLIALTFDRTFFLPITCTLAVVSSFSSGRAYPSLNFLSPLFLCLIPTLIM